MGNLLIRHLAGRPPWGIHELLLPFPPLQGHDVIQIWTDDEKSGLEC